MFVHLLPRYVYIYDAKPSSTSIYIYIYLFIHLFAIIYYIRFYTLTS